MPSQPVSEDSAEFLERVPSLAFRGLIYVLVALAVVAVAFAALAEIDMVVAGEGSLKPFRAGQTIQAPVAGELTAVLVREGQQVKAGEPLIRLRSPQVARELSAMRRADGSLTAATREEHDALPVRLRLLEKRVEAMLRQKKEQRAANVLLEQTLESEQASAELQRKEADADLAAQALELEATRRSVKAAQARLDAAEEFLSKGQKLAKRGVLTRDEVDERHLQTSLRRLELEDARGQVQVRRKRLAKALLVAPRIEADLRTRQKRVQQGLRESAASLAALDGQVASLRLEIERTKQASRKAVTTAERDLEHARGAVSPGSKLVGDEVVLVAPQAGTVVYVATERPGILTQVGQLLVTIVPAGTPIVAEVAVANDKVPHLRVGQEVKLKFPAYPYEEFGVFRGRLQRIASDVVTQKDGSSDLSYKVTVELIDTHVSVDAEQRPLRIGLACRAEAITRRHSLLFLLMQPFQALFKGGSVDR